MHFARPGNWVHVKSQLLRRTRIAGPFPFKNLKPFLPSVRIRFSNNA